MWQGVGACGRGSDLCMDGDMRQGWEHVTGCGYMWHGWWQGVGACGRGLHTSTQRALVECSSYVQTAMCKLLCANGYVQTAMCKLLCANCYVQTDRANWSCKLVMQTGHANCLCISPRALVESCTNDRGVPLAVFSLWVWGHGGWGQGLGVCGRAWGYVAGCGGMWQGVGACGRGSDLCMD